MIFTLIEKRELSSPAGTGIDNWIEFTRNEHVEYLLFKALNWLYNFKAPGLQKGLELFM